MKPLNKNSLYIILGILFILLVSYATLDFLLQMQKNNEIQCLIKEIVIKNSFFGVFLLLVLWISYKKFLKPYLKYVKTLEEKNTTQLFHIKQQEDELIAKSKFAAMGEMIDMIAHQWNQPLNTLSLHVNSIKMMVDNKKIIKKEFDKTLFSIYTTIDYMSQTIDDFRGFLRSEKNTQDISIEDLILKPKFLIEKEFSKHNITFEFDCTLDAKKLIRIDSSKFYQIAMNLYKNSIDEFVSKKIENPTITVRINACNNKLYCIFEDNAGGIPSNIIKRVFDPYFSTKSKNGTGLGLYMCKRILNEYLNGDISVKNNEKGAVFTIEISKEGKEKEKSFESLQYNCYEWDKERNQFTRKKEANKNELIQESQQIFSTLDEYFIQYKVDEDLNIKIVF